MMSSMHGEYPVLLSHHVVPMRSMALCCYVTWHSSSSTTLYCRVTGHCSDAPLVVNRTALHCHLGPLAGMLVVSTLL
jgi:hypothetical protein